MPVTPSTVLATSVLFAFRIAELEQNKIRKLENVSLGDTPELTMFEVDFEYPVPYSFVVSSGSWLFVHSFLCGM